MAALEDNLHWLIIAVIVLAVFLYAVVVIITILKRKMRVSNASREIALLKMDLLSKQAHLENLIEDSVQWSPKDLKDYDRTLDDQKLLKSKLDTGMTIADSKVKRLELGNETYELFETLGKIRKYEDKLYGEGVLDGEGR
ncbi:MAG: hypothetical protein ACMUHU_07675 [Thermoplasmatota archaeon]